MNVNRFKAKLGKQGFKAVIDVETGGFNPLVNGMCEIAVVILNEDNEEVDSYSTLIKPYHKEAYTPPVPQKGKGIIETLKKEVIPEEMKMVYSEKAQKIHGITIEEMQEHGEESRKVCYEVDSILFKHRVRTIIAHNKSFEESHLDEFWRRFAGENKIVRDEIICTMDMAKKKLPKRKSYSLENLCKDLSIKNDQAHRALGDARATADLFRYMIRKTQ